MNLPLSYINQLTNDIVPSMPDLSTVGPLRVGPGQDHYWRPLPTLKSYNLHALTIVIITKYIYIFVEAP